MKTKLLALLAATVLTGACLSTLSGCTSAPAPIPPAQLFQQFCVASETVNAIILTTPGVPANAVKSINDAQPILAKVCASGVALNAVSLNSLVTDGLPLLAVAIDALPPATPNLAALKLAVALAPVIVPQLIADLPVATAK